MSTLMGEKIKAAMDKNQQILTLSFGKGVKYWMNLVTDNQKRN